MQTQTHNEQIAQYIQASLGGDHQAFAELVRQHEPMLLAFALYRLPYYDEAAEAVQDTFVRAFERLSDFRPDADFGTWLRSICRFMILSRVKSYTRHKIKHDDYKGQITALVAEHLSTAPGPDSVDDDLLVHLSTCRNGLSDVNQTLINARYMQSLSIQRISEKTGRTETWVTSTLHRVRSALRTCIENKIKEQSDE